MLVLYVLETFKKDFQKLLKVEVICDLYLMDNLVLYNNVC